MTRRERWIVADPGPVRVPEVAMTAVELDDARDRDLLRRIRGGEEDAFRVLFDRYASIGHALARRVVRHAFLAEEIVQETFLAVWRNPEAYDASRGTVRAWLLGMIHHRAVDAVRREESQRRRAADAGAEIGLETQEDLAELAAADVDRPGEQAAVRRALAELPADQRRVVELMYYAGLSQSQIAARLELPLGTVKSRTLLAMRKLRGALVGVGDRP